MDIPVVNYVRAVVSELPTFSQNKQLPYESRRDSLTLNLDYIFLLVL